jgi:hypothetical protein
MRTTIRLDPQVAAAAQQIQTEQNVSFSSAVNQLAMRGLLAHGPTSAAGFEQLTYPMGLKVDISNIADALEQIEELGGL